MSDTGKYEVTCTCQGCVLTLAACYWAGIRRDISYGENQPKVSAVELYFDRYFLTSKTQVPLWLGEPYCFSAVWDVVVLCIFPYISLCKSCSSNENLLKAYIMHLIWAPCWDTLLCHIDMVFFFGATFWTHYQALQRCTALITTDWYWHFFLSVLGLAWLSPLLFFYFFLFFFLFFFVEEELVSNTSQLFLLANQFITEAWLGRILRLSSKPFCSVHRNTSQSVSRRSIPQRSRAASKHPFATQKGWNWDEIKRAERSQIEKSVHVPDPDRGWVFFFFSTHLRTWECSSDREVQLSSGIERVI